MLNKSGHGMHYVPVQNGLSAGQKILFSFSLTYLSQSAFVELSFITNFGVYKGTSVAFGFPAIHVCVLTSQ